MHPAVLTPEALRAEVQEVHARRSGPGGQHRNKVQTGVVLVHRPTGISAEATERRSQAANRRVALGRLRLRLALEHRTPPLPVPSPLWLARTRGRRIAIAADHEDYPALVAEALDRLHAEGLHMPAAAAALGLTTTQLTRLFRKTAAAWVMLNRLRAGRGLPTLR